MKVFHQNDVERFDKFHRWSTRWLKIKYPTRQSPKPVVWF